MFVKNQSVQIKWSLKNKDYYISKGYELTNIGDVFTVKLEDLPSNSSCSVRIICDYCGNEYQGNWLYYNKSNCKKHACKRCKVLKIHEKTLKERQEKLYFKVIEKCRENGYSLLTKKEEIKNNTTYIEYVCPKHGTKSMRIANFINGRKCPDCNHEKIRDRYKKSSDDVERMIEECGGKLLNKDDYINQSTKNLKVKCPRCGGVFFTSLRNFVQHGGQVCSNCRSSESLGETKIKQYLDENRIEYKQEHWFDDCRDINPLPFDFWLQDLNTIIEFDGRQHFEETSYFSYPLDIVKKHDNIKNEYCLNNDINLIRISYKDINVIDKILKNKLFLHEDIV